MNIKREVKRRIRTAKAAVRKNKSLMGYAWKTLTKPAGTTFEIRNERVNRFTYIRETVAMLRKI